MAATDASAARRRFALVPPSQRGVVGAVALPVDDCHALLVVSAGIGALCRGSLRRCEPVRAAVVWLRRSSAARLSHRSLCARSARCAAAARRRARRRNRCHLSVGHSRRNAAERRLARRVLSGELHRARYDRRPLCRHAHAGGDRTDQTARLDLCRHCAGGTARTARRLARRSGGPRTLDCTRRSYFGTAAILAPASAAYGNITESTIVAHGAAALLLLLHVGATISPFALIALAAALIAPVLLPKQRALGWSGCAAALLFFALPFGYDTSVAQLATGASLRFAAPAVAAGALALAPVASRFAYVAIALLWGTAMYGIVYVLGIFWNDGSTHAALPVAVAVVAIAAVDSQPSGWPGYRQRRSASPSSRRRISPGDTRSTITPTRCAWDQRSREFIAGSRCSVRRGLVVGDCA